MSGLLVRSSAAAAVARVTVHVPRRAESLWRGSRARCGVARTRNDPAAYEGPAGAALLRIAPQATL